MVSAEGSGPVAKEALVMAMGLGQCLVVGLEEASVEALVVVLGALVEGLTAGWGDRASPPARQEASGR